MRIEKGTLILENHDCEHIQGHIDEGYSPKEALETELFLGGIKKNEFGDIQINMNYLELCCKIVADYWNSK